MVRLSKARELFGKNFYPALLAFSLGLCLDISTDGFCSIEHILSLSALLVFIVLATQLILGMAYRPPKAAFLTAAILLWIPCFGCFGDALDHLFSALRLAALNKEIYLILYCIVGIIVFKVCSTITVSSFTTKSINAIVAVFFLMVLFKETGLVYKAEQDALKANAQMRKQNGDIKLQATLKPDIYYIILDSAACPKTLHDLFDMKTVSFFTFLKNKGFYVAENSKSNYDRTKFSLSSSLNLNFINFLTEILSKHSDNETLFCRLIQNSEVANSLRRIGYQIVNVKSGYPLSENNPQADKNPGLLLGAEITTALAMEMTILGALEPHTDLLGSITRAKESWAFYNIKEVQKLKSPKFVFVHILLPHPPFLFAANGDPLPLSNKLLSEEYTKEKYRGQITYAFTAAEKMINDLLLSSQSSLPIIILQGDHGSMINSNTWPYSEEYLTERFGILNAYFFPRMRNKALYDSISPVNTFRVIFNQYFQAHLPLLPDNSYYAPLTPPYSWTLWENKSQTK